jgi:hypothetical protein
MRRLPIGFVLLTAALLVVLIPGSGPGTAQSGAVNHIVLNKVVLGDVPAGAVFTVHVGCTDEAQGAPTVGVLDQTVTFDERGNPAAITIDVPTNLTDNGSVVCDVTEVSGFPTGSQIVNPNLYACVVTTPGTSNPAGGADASCGFLRADVVVGFPFSRVDAVVTVTVTNQFAEAPPPPPVTVQPIFTG